jgi:hypothetical protein
MIIAISGKIGSGKSAATDYIIKNLKEYNFKKKSFAFNVKKICSILTGKPFYKFKSREGKNELLKEWNLTYGQIQQKVGDECIRQNLNTNAWCISLLSTYNKNENWIIDDLRYKNEFFYLKEHDAILIRLNGDPKNINKNDTRDKNHNSEIELDDCIDFDIIFENKAPISNLEILLELILIEIKKRDL